MSAIISERQSAEAGRVRVAGCIVTFRSDLEDVACAAQSFTAADLSTHLTIVDNRSGPAYFGALRDAVHSDRIIDSGANRGFGFGHNCGIRTAPVCDYYLVLNPDIVIHAGTLERMVEFMDRNPDVGLAGPRILNPDGSLQHLNKQLPTVFDLFARRFLPRALQRLPWVRRRMDRYVMLDKGYDSVVDVPYVSGCFMLFRKAALDAVGEFDEGFFMYLEEADMTRRLNRQFRSVFLPDAVVTHKWARGSHRSWWLTWITIRSAVHYFNKWGWKLI